VGAGGGGTDDAAAAAAAANDGGDGGDGGGSDKSRRTAAIRWLDANGARCQWVLEITRHADQSSTTFSYPSSPEAISWLAGADHIVCSWTLKKKRV
jgi:hypothetical protein